MMKKIKPRVYKENPDHDHVEPYRVPMTPSQKDEWSNAVQKSKDIASGKVVPPYLKGK